MAKVAGLRCLRCNASFGVQDYASACPKCSNEAAPSNLVVAYEDGDAAFRPRPRPSGTDRGFWRYGDILPVSSQEAVSLGEGGTPLRRLSSLGKDLGLQGLFGKDETRNPTWSFKDRLACIAVSTAKKMGAPAVVSSSTGNAGASVAAYAAKASLPCVVFTAAGAAGPLLTQMRVYGATVVSLARKDRRWPLMRHAVEQFGWFPTSPFFSPVVGSNPYGIEGYKTLAYEVAEAMDWRVPDCCVLPVCYGDALIGMWRGFEEMLALGWTSRMPRMMAAEVYGSLGTALLTGGDALPDMPMTHDTLAKSTTATRSTFQALYVLRKSGGAATTVSNEAILEYQAKLARLEGLYVEPASAGAIAAVAQLRATGQIRDGEAVVALLTASGLKDPQATAVALGEPPTVEDDLEAVFAHLREAVPAAFEA
ncbi:pyridoxal-phosphate dependent enzyme [Bradyrhizobium sp. NP1]|uniref:pyridoxal-phosphate dependent enzyme n=1 Tax=Bradyrhizobium sp. NP1 TaxID=3049772 RepID=UPI0025A563BC|nr:pyridoxal-phosphate dependent enzyme [Bradyrhizobium sp. NP1]WJR80341.1 pyridoxal-phosphate dependent enzyme [Bradyrhizobium sp. NP1]